MSTDGFVSMQDHYNLLAREEEREMIPLCLDEGIGTIVWSPLARETTVKCCVVAVMMAATRPPAAGSQARRS